MFLFFLFRLILKSQWGVHTELESHHARLDEPQNPTLSTDHVAVAWRVHQYEAVQNDSD